MFDSGEWGSSQQRGSLHSQRLLMEQPSELDQKLVVEQERGSADDMSYMKAFSRGWMYNWRGSSGRWLSWGLCIISSTKPLTLRVSVFYIQLERPVPKHFLLHWECPPIIISISVRRFCNLWMRGDKGHGTHTHEILDCSVWVVETRFECSGNLFSLETHFHHSFNSLLECGTGD